MKKFKYQLIIFAVLCLGFTAQIYAEELQELTGVIHVHSVVSPSGKYSFEKIAGFAKEKNIDVVIFTDHAMTRVEYEFLPCIKQTIEYDSVLKFGPQNYLDQIKRTNEKFPELILIPGVEAEPFYYWTGSIFKKNLILNDWDKHILVIGLKNAEDYLNLPLLSSKYSTKHSNGIFLLLVVISAAVFVVFIMLQNIRKVWKILVVIVLLAAASVVICIYNNPDDEPYKKGGIFPYQNLIDYANDKGALTFWAHPEANTKEDFSVVKSITPPHPDDIILAKNYTGFAALEEGYKYIAKPAGKWDDVLLDYCSGLREKPVWAIFELDYTSEGGPGGLYLDTERFVLYVKEKTEKGCLEALKEGRFYNIKGTAEPVRLNEFSVAGDGSVIINAGETGKINSKEVKIKVKISSLKKDDKRLLTIKLIKNGFITQVFTKQIPVELTIPDVQGKDPVFYRMEVWERDELRILTNPVFLK